MKPTLKSISLILLVAIIFTSCKKDPASSYYIKFKMNGTWETWRNAIGQLGPNVADDTKTNFGLTAFNEGHTELLGMTIEVDSTQLNTGTYNSDNGGILLSYTKNLTTNSSFYTIGRASDRPDSKYLITITEITDNAIHGTFTGNYLQNEFAGNDLVDITEGEFVLLRAN